jgi:tRNA-dihydrouridine synthase B
VRYEARRRRVVCPAPYLSQPATLSQGPREISDLGPRTSDIFFPRWTDSNFAGRILPMVFEELRIRNVTIRPAAILAPMAGITDTVFRRFIKPLGGCGLIMTEFVSSEGLLRQNLKSRRFLYYTEEERPISAQIFGADPDHLADAARQIEDLGFDLVDLNLGCPAKKVVKCGGSGLLRDLPLLGEIFRRIRAAVSIPFTIKIRIGWDDNEIVAEPVAKMAEEAGVEAIAIHGRTRLQGFSGRARWDVIREVKETVRIPIIGNGDVMRPEDARALHEETQCDAVMIGRAAPTNPWIFRQMADYFSTGAYTHPTESDRYQLIRDYYAMLVEEEMPGAIGKMKQFASWFTHGVRNGAALRRSVQSASDTRQVLERVDEFFGQTTAPVAAAG